MGRSALRSRLHSTWPVAASASTAPLALTPLGAPVTWICGETDGLGVADGRGAVPQLGEQGVAVEPTGNQRGEPPVTGIAGRGTTQVGDDRAVGRLAVLRDDRPVSQADGRVAGGREPGRDQVAVLGRE